MKRFWEIIKDDRSQTFEVLGLSSNDTKLTNDTASMQDSGMHVRCETIDEKHSEDDISDQYRQISISKEKGLMERLKYEYLGRTSKHL